MSKVWLITGSSRGLGRAFTKAVLEAGDRVVATARKPEQLADLQATYGGNIRRDCYVLAERSGVEKLESDRMWKDLSTSTDFVAAEGQGGNT